jgi:hypothetical protein
MESAHLTNTSESEDIFDTKKSKHNATQRRHIAREALLYEGRHRAPEARQLHGEEKAPEHIGHVLINAESIKRNREAQHETRAQLPPNTRIETLSRAELLILSEQIAVETSSLRNVYETHLIGEQALRRLVAEYLHGGDINKALQREIVEHEIDFERDPALRNLPAYSDSHDNTHQATFPPNEALSQLLQKAVVGIGGSDSGQELTYGKPGTSYAEEHGGRAHHQRRPIDIVMGVTIVLLVILVIALYFWHH